MKSWAKWVFFLIGLGSVTYAGQTLSSTHSFVAHAVRTQGTVVGFRTNYAHKTGRTYVPIVQFVHGPVLIEFSGSFASNPPSYHVGETVPVLYLESDPYDARIDSFLSLWGGALIIGGLGSIFLLVGGGLLVKGYRTTSMRPFGA
jgi:hypothetical protein